MTTWILILWTFTKSGTPHFSYVRDLPSQQACEELASKVAGTGHYCTQKASDK